MFRIDKGREARGMRILTIEFRDYPPSFHLLWAIQMTVGFPNYNLVLGLRLWALGFLGITFICSTFALHQADLFIVRPDRLKDELN